MNKVKMYSIENELYYQGEVIVRYKIEYPEIIVENENMKNNNKEIVDREIKTLNYENRKAVLYLKEYIEGELYEQAKCMYEYNKEHGYPITVYELVRECNIAN